MQYLGEVGRVISRDGMEMNFEELLWTNSGKPGDNDESGHSVIRTMQNFI